MEDTPKTAADIRGSYAYGAARDALTRAAAGQPPVGTSVEDRAIHYATRCDQLQRALADLLGCINHAAEGTS